MTNWQDSVVFPETSLGDAIAKIDSSSLQIALVLNPNQTLAGVLTDGDIRRAILAGQSLQIPVSEVMNPNPTVASAQLSRTEMLGLMRRRVIHQLPLVEENHRVVGLVTLDELIGAVDRPNWVVLMAGGRGTRLQPLTNDCPKPLLKVGGKPILETIIETFAAQGFQQIFLSVNYKAEMIQDYFGKGDHWGVHIEYLHETNPLGTAGALSLLPEKPTHPIIVMNGDLLTHTSFNNLLQFHNDQLAMATMAVREYDIQIPYGVVQVNGNSIKAIKEKPRQSFFINAGIYVLSPEAFHYLPKATFFDMPSLFEYIINDAKKAAAYPIREYWLDIGRMEEFERAQREWRIDKV